LSGWGYSQNRSTTRAKSQRQKKGSQVSSGIDSGDQNRSSGQEQPKKNGLTTRKPSRERQLTTDKRARRVQRGGREDPLRRRRSRARQRIHLRTGEHRTHLRVEERAWKRSGKKKLGKKNPDDSRGGGGDEGWCGGSFNSCRG